jgi:hypothetical protein
MKKISELINEYRGNVIDDQWINDEKPVMTKDGRVAVILSVDMKEIPNVIKGQVKIDDEMVDYEWLDNGICVKACDRNGNPKNPSESDTLVKAK